MNRMDMEIGLLNLINFSSLSTQQISRWCEETFPHSTFKISSEDDVVPENAARVLIFYDSLPRRLNETALKAEGTLVDIVTQWHRDAQKILDCVADNPERRLCLETDAVHQERKNLEALCGQVAHLEPMHEDVLPADPASLITALLLQHDNALHAVWQALQKLGATSPLPAESLERIAATTDTFAALASAAESWAEAVTERERWLASLRTTTWEATARAQQAEALRRDWESLCQALQKQAERVPILEQSVQQAETYRRTMHIRVDELEHQARERQQETENLRAHADKLKAHTEELKAHIDQLYKSTSWRITSPVRGLKRMLSRTE